MPTPIDKQVTARFVKAIHALIGADRPCKTKRQMAEALGDVPQSILKLEKNELVVTLDHISKLHKQFKVSLPWLFTGDGDMFAINNPATFEKQLDKLTHRIEKLEKKK